MGITKKELRDIIKEEVLKELQRLDEVNFSTGSGDFVTGGPSSGPAPRWLQNVMADEAEAEADAHIRRLRNAEDARAAKWEKENKRRQRGYAVEGQLDELRKEAYGYIRQLSALNKKGWLTRKTIIGGNWKKQRADLIEKLKDLYYQIREKIKKLQNMGAEGFDKDKRPDYTRYRLGPYEHAHPDGSLQTYVVYAFPEGTFIPSQGEGRVEGIDFERFIDMAEKGSNR